MGQLISPHAQRGFVLFMTLMTLVLLTLSGLAMMRSMEAGVSASGNIAFRQAALRVADVAIEDAVLWLTSKSGTETLNADAQDAQGNTFYYPAVGAFNPASHGWESGASHLMPDKISGYEVYYVIHRMAQAPGSCKSATANAHCQYVPGMGETGTTREGTSHAGGGQYSTFITGTSGKVYYRITVKVSGPRHNVSYVQAFVY